MMPSSTTPDGPQDDAALLAAMRYLADQAAIAEQLWTRWLIISSTTLIVAVVTAGAAVVVTPLGGTSWPMWVLAVALGVLVTMAGIWLSRQVLQRATPLLGRSPS
ncbi:hypothetical protein GCM10029964_092220 [Kibdelosporangium lantanae]